MTADHYPRHSTAWSRTLGRTILQGFASSCCSSYMFPIFLDFSTSSRRSALLSVVAGCSQSMHEKGKKRASLGKALIPGPIVRTAVQRLIAVVKPIPTASRNNGAAHGPETRVVSAGSIGWASDSGFVELTVFVRRTIKDFAHRSGVHRLGDTHAVHLSC